MERVFGLTIHRTVQVQKPLCPSLSDSSGQCSGPRCSYSHPDAYKFEAEKVSTMDVPSILKCDFRPLRSVRHENPQHISTGELFLPSELDFRLLGNDFVSGISFFLLPRSLPEPSTLTVCLPGDLVWHRSYSIQIQPCSPLEAPEQLRGAISSEQSYRERLTDDERLQLRKIRLAEFADYDKSLVHRLIKILAYSLNVGDQIVVRIRPDVRMKLMSESSVWVPPETELLASHYSYFVISFDWLEESLSFERCLQRLEMSELTPLDYVRSKIAQAHRMRTYALTLGRPSSNIIASTFGTIMKRVTGIYQSLCSNVTNGRFPLSRVGDENCELNSLLLSMRLRAANCAILGSRYKVGLKHAEAAILLDDCSFQAQRYRVICLLRRGVRHVALVAAKELKMMLDEGKIDPLPKESQMHWLTRLLDLPKQQQPARSRENVLKRGIQCALQTESLTGSIPTSQTRSPETNWRKDQEAGRTPFFIPGDPTPVYLENFSEE